MEVEFYILTSGFVEIPRATPIAKEFKGIFSGEFHFDDAGDLSYVRKTVPHAEKVNYLPILSKGLEEENNNPAHAYRKIPEAKLHVPLSQVIYVGDGASDIPAFNLMYESWGVALGLYSGDDASTWASKADVHPGQRVENLVRTNYRADSELMQSLTLATESMCRPGLTHMAVLSGRRMADDRRIATEAAGPLHGDTRSTSTERQSRANRHSGDYDLCGDLRCGFVYGSRAVRSR